MSGFSVKEVKELRDETGAGMMLCKQALEEVQGDREKAVVWLRQKGISIADGKAGRFTNEGMVGSYIHTGGKVGVLVEVLCETDFVARSEPFQQLVRDLGMQIASAPSTVSFVSVTDIPDHIVTRETEVELGKNDLASKPDAIRAKIVEGRIAKRLKDFCLMEQPFIKDSSLTVSDYVKSVGGKVGENVKVSRFVRFTLGCPDNK